MGELKGMDTTIFYNPVVATTGTNGNTTTLNLVQTGTGSWNRVGRKIHIKSVRVKGEAIVEHVLSALGDFIANQLRMILVWDSQPAGGTEPLFSDIFGETSQAGVETSTWFSQPKYDTMSRFTILKDWTYESSPQAGVNANGDIIRNTFAVDCYIRLNNLESTYSGQSSPMTIADINNGALYLVARAAIDNATSSVASVSVRSRIRYTD